MPPPRRIAPDDIYGRKLGRYELLCRLNGGGMSHIFLALRRGAGGFCKHVVIKQILPELRGDEDFLRMFLREAKITAVLNHPHIAQVFDLGVDKGELFIVMEFVHGATLVDVARALRSTGNRIPIGLTAAAIRDTAVALQYVHSFSAPGLGQLVHRDVAEKNVMITFDGTAKLLDFGIAKSLSSLSRTATGTVKGTPGYIAPEQIRGEPVTQRSDIFSLGVVLYQCLTDMMLFQGSTPIEQMAATLSTEVQPPSRINLDVPPQLDAVVLRALDRDPNKRYASAQEFAEAVEDACSSVLWRPAQVSALLKRSFPDRVDDVQRILAMVPDEPEVDAAGRTVLSRLLARSAEAQSAEADEEIPWAEAVTPAAQVPQVPQLSPQPAGGSNKPQTASPLGPTPASGLANFVPEEETTNRQDGAVELVKEVLAPPPQAMEHRPTVNLRSEAAESTATTGQGLPDDPDEITSSFTVDPLTLEPVPAAEQPAPQVTDDVPQTMVIQNMARVHSVVKAPEALPPNVLARKKAAQKMGVTVGSGIVGAAIALIGLTTLLGSRGDDGPPADNPGPMARPHRSGASGGGGGGAGGGGGGGGGPEEEIPGGGGEKGKARLQKPIPAAFQVRVSPPAKWTPPPEPVAEMVTGDAADSNAPKPAARADDHVTQAQLKAHFGAAATAEPAAPAPAGKTSRQKRRR